MSATFIWLMVGAVLGMVSVFVTAISGVELQGWVGALVVLLSATAVGTIGPMFGNRAEQHPDTGRAGHPPLAGA